MARTSPAMTENPVMTDESTVAGLGRHWTGPLRIGRGRLWIRYRNFYLYRGSNHATASDPVRRGDAFMRRRGGGTGRGGAGDAAPIPGGRDLRNPGPRPVRRLRARPTQVAHPGGVGAPPGVTTDPCREPADRGGRPVRACSGGKRGPTPKGERRRRRAARRRACPARACVPHRRPPRLRRAVFPSPSVRREGNAHNPGRRPPAGTSTAV